ncbi:helix-turn-helix transcriptional regulator [Gluconacetobacter sp. Hr-1-5]|uniref:helix-turn-helix transcriptional regulator n=1 Tax=Gluconacetobacter sp. Hr-1-5 TaxID=3395370 RepID=UPI003B517076
MNTNFGVYMSHYPERNLPAHSDDVRVYSERQASEFLGLSGRTLQNWRRTGDGPPYVQLSERRVGYTHAALRAWVASRSVRSTSDATVRLIGGAA